MFPEKITLKEPPLCTCGKTCWRPGKMVEMQVNGKFPGRPMTFCMWCCKVWALEVNDGIPKCMEPDQAELNDAKRFLGEAVERQKYNHRLAKALGMEFETFLKKFEPEMEKLHQKPTVN